MAVALLKRPPVAVYTLLVTNCHLWTQTFYGTCAAWDAPRWKYTNRWRICKSRSQLLPPTMDPLNAEAAKFAEAAAR